MNKKSYYKLVSSIFLIVGLLHLLRVLKGWEAVIGGVIIPIWFSWVAVALTFYLAFRGLSFASKLK